MLGYRMMRRFNFAIILMGFYGFTNAQQIPTTNLYTADLYRINSAYAGATGCIQGNLGHLSQFSGISGGPEVSYLGIHKDFFKTMGIGARILLDNTPMINKTSVALSYAYGIKFHEDHNLRFGLSLGFYQVKLDFRNVIVDDITDDVITSGEQSTMTFNNEFSLYYTYKKLYAGISVPQIIETSANYDVNPLNGAFGMERHYMTFVGTNLPIDETWSIQPSLFYRSITFGNYQYDINGQVTYKNLLSAGLGYRSGQGILARFGINFRNRYSLNYAYEAAGGDNIVGASSGSHEILLGLRFCDTKKGSTVNNGNANGAKNPENQVSRIEIVQDSIAAYTRLTAQLQEDSVKNFKDKEYIEAVEMGDKLLFEDDQLKKAKISYERALEFNPNKEEVKNRIKYIDDEIKRRLERKDLSNRDNVIIINKGQDAYVAARSASDIAYSAAKAASRASKIATTAALAATKASESVAKVESESARIAARAAQEAAQEATNAASIATDASNEASNSAKESFIAANGIDETRDIEITISAVEKAVKASEEALTASSIATAAAIEATKAANAAKSAATSSEEVERAGVKEENAAAAREAAKKAAEAAELTKSIVKDLRARMEYLKGNPYDVTKGETFESIRETPEDRKARLLSIITKEEMDLFKLELRFPLGGGVPLEPYILELDKLAKVLNDNKELNIHVVGHACDIGRSHVKRVIAEVRSVYITRYLLFKGVEPSRIKTRGVSDLQPKVAGISEEAREINRRVEFIIE